MDNKLLYIAGPYSGNVEQNIKNAEIVSIGLIKAGFHVLTPHKNTSGYEQYENGDAINYQTWIDLDLDLLSRCDAIYVMSNSENSMGVKKEIIFCEENNIPIIHENEYPPHEFTLELYKSKIKQRDFGQSECSTRSQTRI